MFFSIFFFSWGGQQRGGLEKVGRNGGDSDKCAREGVQAGKMKVRFSSSS